ncbi:MAG: MASE1 domain-containing protein, partial [Acidimicrobiales bacterium]
MHARSDSERRTAAGWLTPAYLVRVVFLAAVYFCAAKVGLSLWALKGNVTPVWPPTGIALAALVLWGYRVWPGVAIGALLVNGLSAVPLSSAAGMAAGNTLEAVAGAYLLGHVVRFHPSLDRLRDVVALTLLAAVGATTLSATVGVASLRLGGVIPHGALWPTWRVWWIGDGLGTLVAAPVILAWRANPSRAVGWRRIEAIVMLGAVGALAYFVFATPLHSPYLLFPVIAWAAIRFTQRGASTATLLVSIVTVIATAHHMGPFAARVTTDALWRLDTFLAVLATSGMILAAVVTDRDGIRDTLQETNRELDNRVQQRTVELGRDRDALAEAQRVARIGSWEWDILTDTVVWTDELCRLFGIDASGFDATYEGYLARLHPDDRSLAEHSVQTAFATLEPFAFEHRTVLPNGEIRWLLGRGRVETDHAGTPVRMHGTAQDVTDRKRAETKFEGLLESAPDGIVVIDSDGVIRLVNRQTETLFGYERSELVGQRIEILLPTRHGQHHPDLRRQYFEAPNTRPMGAGLDLAARRRDGTEFPVDISLSPLETEDGLLVSAAIRDITERKRAEVAMAHQAMHDGLTGLPNRTLLADRLSEALARSRRSGQRIVVLFLDLDRFKVINDSLGHSAGDQLLRAVAGRLVAAVRHGETVARFGGDEFVIVGELDAGEHPDTVGTRLADVLRAPIEIASTEINVTVSIGIALA